MILFLLPYVEPDVGLLTDLKESLVSRDPSSLSLSKACKRDLQFSLQAVCSNEDLLNKVQKAVELHRLMNIDQAAVPSREALVANASSPLRQACMNSCEIIEDEKTSFAQKQVALSECAETFQDTMRLHQDPYEMIKHPEWVLEMAFSMDAPNLERSYLLMTRHQAYYNMTLASIDLLLHRTREGQFPKTLPEGLPKDPVTGKDLDYVCTQDGFILSWDKNNLSDMREDYRRYEFKMQGHNLGTVD